MTNKTSRKRPQASKGGGNRAMANAMQGKRFSNAAGPHRKATDYNRRDKSWKKDY